ncbi:hypothetical protein MRBBS_0488 [Marinobacter sp. BSs20148]|nr:hypothetical protein MRBBS_0488 [Marinobacter sp. BSs20148]
MQLTVLTIDIILKTARQLTLYMDHASSGQYFTPLLQLL